MSLGGKHLHRLALFIKHFRDIHIDAGVKLTDLRHVRFKAKNWRLREDSGNPSRNPAPEATAYACRTAAEIALWSGLNRVIGMLGNDKVDGTPDKCGKAFNLRAADLNRIVFQSPKLQIGHSKNSRGLGRLAAAHLEGFLLVCPGRFQ